MSQQKILKFVVEALNQLEIQYMLTGSMASSFYGEPRASHDFDFIVQLQPSALFKLGDIFTPPDWFFNDLSVTRAIQHGTMFNVVDTNENIKIDFWILSNDEYDMARFSRRRKDKLFGIDVWMLTAEDTIISKLRWSKLGGGSDKQRGDAHSVYEVRRDDLDMSYIELWITKLDLHDEWHIITESAS